MKKYFLLAFLVFCFGCGQKQAANHFQADGEKVNQYNTVRLEKGMTLKDVYEFFGLPKSSTSLSWRTVCYTFQDSENYWVTTEFYDAKLSRWAANDRCESFLPNGAYYHRWP